MHDISPFKKARGNLCMPIVLVTAEHDGIRNIMTAAWSTPASFEPPLIIICIGYSRATHDLILKSGECGINVLSEEQVDLANYCGNISGREVNKFQEMKIPLRSSTVITAPLVEGCACNIELKVNSHFQSGDHTCFVGETVNYYEDPSKLPLVRFRGLYYRIAENLGEVQHSSIRTG